MKALIWKEWREQRIFLLFVVGILLCINIGSIIYLNVPSKTLSSIDKLNDINQNIFLGGGWIILPSLLALILGAVPFVREFSNSTQDFLIQRPISTAKIFWLKFFFGVFILLLSIQLCHLILPIPYSFLVKELAPADIKYHYFTFFYFFFIFLYSAVFLCSLLVKREWPAMLLSPLIIAFGIACLLPLYLILFIVFPPNYLSYFFSFKIIIIFTAYILFAGFMFFSFLVWQKAISKGVSDRKVLWSITGIIFLIYLIPHTILNFSAGLDLKRAIREAEEAGIKLKIEEIIPPPVPDKENAALIYQEAFVLIDKLKEKYKDEWEYMPYESKNKVLEELTVEQKNNITKLLLEDKDFVEFYSLIEEAVNSPKCRFDLNYEEGPAMLLPHLQKMRRLAQLVAARTYILTEENRYKEAWESFLVGIKIGESLKDEPLLISQLVRIALNGIAAASFQPIISVSTEDISIKDYQNLISEIDRKENKLTKGLEADLAFEGTFVYKKLLKGNVKELYGFLGPSEGLGFERLVLTFYCYPGRPLLKQDYAFHARYLNESLNLSRLPYYQIKNKLSKLDKELEEVGWRGKYLLSAILIPALNRAQIRQAQDNARLDGLKLVCALKIYKKNNGYYPDSLAELVPSIIPELLLDEFTGENFIYRKQGKGFILYSLGPNEKDDDGISFEENIKKEGEKRDINFDYMYDRMAYDIVWKCKEQLIGDEK